LGGRGAESGKLGNIVRIQVTEETGKTEITNRGLKKFFFKT
jgi:hypothetical protein